jgi:hypothetical protein
VLPLSPIYSSPAFFIALAAGLLAGTFLALWSWRRSWSFLTTVMVGAVIFVVIGVPVAVPSQALWGILPSLEGLVSLLAGVVLSWKQLVTVMPPVGSYEALLVPVLILTLAGSALAVSGTLRWAGKPRGNLVPLVPLGVLGISIWLGPSQGFSSVSIAIAVFLLSALWFASERAGATPATFRSLGVIGLAALVAISAMSLASVSNRNVWRTDIDQPFVLQENTSPLSEYRSFITGDLAAQTMLESSGLAAGDALSLVTLDRYTGVIYGVGADSADFTRLPGSMPQEESGRTVVSSTVTIGDLGGPWVPLPGVLGEIAFGSSSLTDSFYYSRKADSGAVLSGLASGDTYRATGYASPWISLSEIGALTPGDAIVPAPEQMPQGVDAFIALNSSGASDPAQRLQRTLEALIDQGYISHGQEGEPASASGHGANRIAALFASSPMLGDAEQYAAAAALIATQTGFPSRVVMGFIAGVDAQAESPTVFLGEDMTAWIEINTSSGWVALNPNPPVRPIPDEQIEDPTEVSFPQTAVEPPTQEQPQVSDNAAPEAVEEEQTDTADPVLQAVLAVLWVLGWLLLILGILVSPFALIALLKARRKKKRQSAEDTRDQVLGAWDELSDRLLDNGKPITASASRKEIAIDSGMAATVLVADLADKAQYSQDMVSNADATRAWQDVEAVVVELSSTQTLKERLSATFSLASFGITRSRLASWWPFRR